MLPWIGMTAFFLIGLLVAEGRNDQRVIWLCKPLASAGFVAAAVAAGALHSGYGWAILIALVLSWLGDVLLVPHREGTFLAGLAAFFFCHVALSAAFLLRDNAPAWTAVALVLLAVIAVAVDRWLYPFVPRSLRLPVRLYIAVITLMVALAAGSLAAGEPLIGFLGAFTFFLSDLSVARDRFVKPGFLNRLWGYPVYYAAQLLLAASVAGSASGSIR
jgi:uncharacterized membrane protein YhhN